jgi:SnoaL-like polyketide cyclase
MSNKPNAADRAAALTRADMPSDYQISLDSYIGRDGIGGGFRVAEQRIPDDFGPQQSMSGFESSYPNIIDYIVRITHKIWEDRDIEYITDTYSNDSMVFDDYGLQLGNQKIVSDTHHTTGAFSNIELIADEIIWAGNDEVGYHTSHRTIIRGTNDGDSKYGPTTNRSVDVLVIANCVAKDNKIFLEHVLYNNSALLQQMGFDLDMMVEKMLAQQPAGWPRDQQTWQSLRHATSPESAISGADPISGFDPDAFARVACTSIWRDQDYACLPEFFHSDIRCEGATDRKATGFDEYQQGHQQIMSAFNVDNFSVDEVYWMGNDGEGFLVSIRWSMDAVHSQSGLYGEASQAAVQIWGISQYQVVNGKIINEWTLFNELDLKMQIAASHR